MSKQNRLEAKRRQSRLDVTLSEVEKNRFVASAQKLDLSNAEFVRFLTYVVPVLQSFNIDIKEFFDKLNTVRESEGQKPIRRNRKVELPTPPVDPELTRTISRVGNNINQLAHIANTDVKAGTVDILEYHTVLSEIQDELQEIWEFHHRDYQNQLRKKLIKKIRKEGGYDDYQHELDE